MTHSPHQPKLASGPAPNRPGERVFVIAPLAANPRPENAHRYGGIASGATYVESDPIGLQGGSYSTYAYAGGNPVSNIDPSGEFAWPWPILGGGGAIGGALGYGIGTLIYNSNAVTIQDEIEQYIPYGTTDPELQQLIEQTANAREVHQICDQPPPPGLDPCERAKWLLRRALACRAARQAMTNRWFGGQNDSGHANQMAERDAEVEQARRNVEHVCGKQCP